MWLKFGVALLATFLTGIHEVVRGKANLACHALRCGCACFPSRVVQTNPRTFAAERGWGDKWWKRGHFPQLNV